MLKQKCILVTGATGGIGSVLSEHLASKGYALILTGRTQTKLEKLAASLESKFGRKVLFAASDFTDQSSFKRALELASGGIDGLVIMPPQLEPTPECLPSDEAWEKMFRESFVGPVGFIREIMPSLKKVNRSKVVVVSGISSLQVLSHYATSNVLRLAWLAQTKTLAHAYGPESIHFNTLSLGGVLTPEYVDELQKEAAERKVGYEAVLNEQVNNVPLRKYATPAEVASAIEGLLSPFTDHITGSNFACDGGFTRAY